jgi:hypothetical protein
MSTYFLDGEPDDDMPGTITKAEAVRRLLAWLSAPRGLELSRGEVDELVTAFFADGVKRAPVKIRGLRSCPSCGAINQNPTPGVRCGKCGERAK